MRVHNKPQKSDTQTKLKAVFLEIFFSFFHPKNTNGERSIAPNKCSIKTILIAGNVYKFGLIIVPSKLQRVAAIITARAQSIKFLR
jgi:hypothetical protein